MLQFLLEIDNEILDILNLANTHVNSRNKHRHNPFDDQDARILSRTVYCFIVGCERYLNKPRPLPQFQKLFNMFNIANATVVAENTIYEFSTICNEVPIIASFCLYLSLAFQTGVNVYLKKTATPPVLIKQYQYIIDNINAYTSAEQCLAVVTVINEQLKQAEHLPHYPLDAQFIGQAFAKLIYQGYFFTEALLQKHVYSRIAKL